MIIPDVNLVIYAHIDGYAQHPVALRWWEQLLSGTDDIGIIAPVVMGFVRIVTNRRALTSPLSIEQAASTVDTWFEQPNVRFLPDTNATLRRSLDLLRELGVAGNLTTDAQIAAHALEHSGTVATNDADFSRFAGVKTLNPLLGPA